MSRPIISPLSPIHKNVYERSSKILNNQYTGIPTDVKSLLKISDFLTACTTVRQTYTREKSEKGQ